MTRFDLNSRRAELIALVRAQTGIPVIKPKTALKKGTGGFKIADVGRPGFMGMQMLPPEGTAQGFAAARQVLLDAGVRETYLNAPGLAMVFWPWPGAAPDAKPRSGFERRNPADLPGWLTALDGARYFTREALAHALAETEGPSRTALVAMDPLDFLRLAAPGHSEYSTKAVQSALETTGAFWDVPYLVLEEHGHTASVTGHEGRHRARALAELGVREMPVRIHARWLRWSRTPGEAPTWLVPQNAGARKVRMPQVLGATRINGGVKVDARSLDVLRKIVAYMDALDLNERTRWGKPLSESAGITLSVLRSTLDIPSKTGGPAVRKLAAQGLLVAIGQVSGKERRRGSGGASNFLPESQRYKGEVPWSETVFRPTPAGFALGRLS